MNGNIREAVVLPIEDSLYIVMNATLAISQDISFSFNFLPFLDDYFRRIYLFYLLIIEQQIDLQNIFWFVRRNFTLNSKMANIVEFYFFLVVS
jgi:hypothetical protein